MNNKEKVEKHFSIEFTDTWANDYAHYIYEDTTADDYIIYISTDDPNNLIIGHHVFRDDNDLGFELVRAVIQAKIEPGSKIYIGMLQDGDYWIEEAYLEIIAELDL